MRDFAAIDFETANNNPASICSVGIVVVREGLVSGKLYRLIRPNPNWYLEFNTAVHGLTYHDTIDAERFPEVWREAHLLIDGLPLVAHFSQFDEGCLRAAHSKYGMTYPDYIFHCTCAASRRVFGNSLPNHKLPTVATICGFSLQAHHNALADAEACAAIATHIL